jgi:dimethylhistidine N-methyltransferase
MADDDAIPGVEELLVPAPAIDSPAFLADVLDGLARRPKSIPCKWLYDRRGSELFDAICRLDEYYLPRVEARILADALPGLAAWIGPCALVLEPGSGSGHKTLRLLQSLADPVGWAPIDISGPALVGALRSMRAELPQLELLPVHGDFTQAFAAPAPLRRPRRRLLFFPGSTIGNFAPPDAAALLRRFATATGPGGALLIGVDLRKDPELLRRAYDDSRGVTAAFNRNLLARLARELGADIRPERFAHRARWNDAEGRIEMHLESLADQQVRLAGRRFTFRAGETIHTEDSYKWRLPEFTALLARAGWNARRVCCDPQGWFAVVAADASRAAG